MHIFVTVGTHPQPFDRLLQELDRLAGRGKLKGKMFAQIGHSTHHPKHFQWKAFMDIDTFHQHMEKADLIVTHGGEGSIGMGLQMHKKMIMVPRLQRFGEHTNDHQLELVSAVEKEGRAIALHRMGDLGNVIEKAHSFRPKPHPGNQRIIALLNEFVDGKMHE